MPTSFLVDHSFRRILVGFFFPEFPSWNMNNLKRPPLCTLLRNRGNPTRIMRGWAFVRGEIMFSDCEGEERGVRGIGSMW